MMSTPRRLLLVAAAVSAAVLVLGASAAGAVYQLPDGRTLELVTPTASPAVRVDVLPLSRVSDTGNAIAFETFGNRDVGPSNTFETYLSTRGANGWSVKLLSPTEVLDPRYSGSPEMPANPFYAFNSDLSQALFDTPASLPLVAGEPAGSDNLYLGNTASGTYSLITTRASGNQFLGPDVAAASPDLQHVAFDNGDGGEGGNYFGAFGGGSSEVYAWSPDQGMSLASIMPDGQIADAAVVGSGSMSSPEFEVSGFEYGTYMGNNPHAISDDGSRIVFTNSGPSTDDAVGHLYERRDQGQPDPSTVQVDAPAPGAPINNDSVYGLYSAAYIDATSDGHQVLFRSCQPLTADSTAFHTFTGPGGSGWACRTPNDNIGDSVVDISNLANAALADKNDLYIYNEDGNGGAGSLTDITTGDPNGADVLGVLGESADLSRVYFAARGNLTGTAPTVSDYCHTPAGQQINLYVWDKTQGTRFIAPLQAPTDYCFGIGNADIPDWQIGLDPEHKDVAITPDGRYLAFATYQSLDSSYDNLDPDIPNPHKEVYLYDYNNPGSVPVCVSCVGSGPATSDATLQNQSLSTANDELPNFTDWQKQNLLPDGSELYFESGDKLVSADHNTTTDVYEYKPATGALSLISSGQSTEPSNFMGASPDGSNVFFSTDQSLLPSDIDNNINIYDARVAGGVANTPPPPPACQRNCPSTPATSTFVGPGNSTPPVVGKPASPPAFALARLTSAQIKALAASGKVTLTITAPGAGRVSAKALARIGKGPAKTVGSASTSARAAGKLRLTLSLSSGARRALRKAGHLAVTIEALFGRSVKTVHVILTHKR